MSGRDAKGMDPILQNTSVSPTASMSHLTLAVELSIRASSVSHRSNRPISRCRLEQPEVLTRAVTGEHPNPPDNFSYHLKKLTGKFVRHTAGGYELRRPGRKVVQEIIAGVGSASPKLETTRIDMACVRCGAPTAVSYDDEWLYQVCTECEGFFGDLDRFPAGMLNELVLEPAGLDPERTPEDLFAAAWSRVFGTLFQQINGVCPTCSGPVEASLEVCEYHDPSGLCETCGRLSETAVYYWCTSCKNDHRSLLRMIAMVHPAVLGFYDRHGVEVGWGLGEFTSVKRMLESAMEHEVELLRGETDRVRVTVSEAGDEITLTFDENINAVDVER